MPSLFRPLITSLLCWVIAFGQMPALLHVVSCSGHGHLHNHCQEAADQDTADQEAEYPAVQGSSRACAHGCGHQVAATSIREDAQPNGAEQCRTACDGSGQVSENGQVPEDNLPEHNSDRCVVCQSLLSPVGVVWNFQLPLVHGSLSELASICGDRLPVTSSFAIPQPRGPPVLV
jgi:hypothetical protein